MNRSSIGRSSLLLDDLDGGHWYIEGDLSKRKTMDTTTGGDDTSVLAVDVTERRQTLGSHLSIVKPNNNELALQRTSYAARRTVLAGYRTIMAEERTSLSWMKMALSTLSFAMLWFKLSENFHEHKTEFDFIFQTFVALCSSVVSIYACHMSKTIAQESLVVMEHELTERSRENMENRIRIVNFILFLSAALFVYNFAGLFIEILEVLGIITIDGWP